MCVCVCVCVRACEGQSPLIFTSHLSICIFKFMNYSVCVNKLLCPCACSVVSVCMFGCVRVLVWLCPCACLVVFVCMFGCIRVLVWLCPCACTRRLSFCEA